MDTKVVRDLLEILNETDVTEIELEFEGNRVYIKKGKSESPVAISHAGEYHPQPFSAETAKRGVQREMENYGSSEDDLEEGQDYIHSPMVGTFYSAPAPDAEPYIKAGDIVKPGQVLCIIEAMKLMNEIEAEVEGRIVDVLVENAQPVEYGEPLFVIEPIK